MMRSLFSGVSGLKVHQTKMDVIANNISNVNTIGFKSSRATFSDIFYQRIQGASAANPETGRAGTNAMQIGLGASVASIDNIMTQGAAQRTDNATDVMVSGNGFFVVSDGSGIYFTRAGNIGRDAENNLHINGMQLMGWDIQYNATTRQYEVQKGTVKPISLSGEKQYMQPEPTSLVNLKGNLNALEDPKVTRTMEFYDSVGNKYTVDVEYNYMKAQSDHENSYWSFDFITGTDGNGNTGVMVYPNNDRKNGKLIAIDVLSTANKAAASYKPGDPYSPGGVLCFDTNGNLTSYGVDDGTGTITFENMGNPPRIDMAIMPLDVLDPTATFGDYDSPISQFEYATGKTIPIGAFSLDLGELTQFEGEKTNLKMLYANGNEPGQLEDISIGSDGKITGRYTNGKTRVLAQIPVAKFTNPAGLEKVGSSLYSTTSNSGQFDGTGEIGELMGGVLEMSNVDLSSEFTEMITTQRGFQANSRVITTSDDMLQELVNLKR